MYVTRLNTYPRDPAVMTPGKIKQAFALLMDQMPTRIETITDYLFESQGVRYSLDSNDEELERLPDFISKLGGLRTLSDQEFESSIENAHPGLKDFFRNELPRTDLDEETLAMATDAGLLWGEIFRHRYPQAVWQIGAKPRSSIDYGWPVLAGSPFNRSEFNPQRELIGFVYEHLERTPSHRTICRLTKLRAHALGLGPDPGVEMIPKTILE
jgi:hypothetical protein